ncbi:uncharacterized protein EAE97_004259 [Botrytis byssoidea]|uniref:Receptor L-domain domain-containing protein n=1 Tax=Botrytis byssoidea TaxID=139641 RepID=A0A9P5IPL4_9HELO|nr:uncharacterized protein EAE97_004259 [Botrytis byssoidea]KAF7947010.1 hypothetical protein EAE97_004259 [Botrytis byssoidea]
MWNFFPNRLDRVCSQSIVIVIEQAKASAVSACKYILGRLIVTLFKGTQQISLEGLEVFGSIEMNSLYWRKFQGVSSSTLRYIAQNLTIDDVDIPTFWSFPGLKSIYVLNLRNCSSPLNVDFPEIVVVEKANIKNARFASGFLPNMGAVHFLRAINNLGLKLIDSSNASHFHIQAPPSNSSLQVYSSAQTFFDGEIYGAAEVHMPALEFCHSLILAANNFSSYSAPKLEYVQGNLEITGNENLRTISLPLLQRVALLEHSESFYEGNNTLIGNSSLKVTGNGNLQDISMPALTHVDKDLEMSGSKNLMHINLTSLAEIRGRLAVINVTFTKIPLPSLKILSPSLHGAMKNGTRNCSRIPSELGSINTPGGSLACLDFSPSNKYTPVLENIGSKHGFSSIFVAPSIIFGILLATCIIIFVKNRMRSAFVFESAKSMSFNLLSSHRTTIENIPELMTVERSVELTDPWQEMYELEATEYHELDSLPIIPTSIETSSSVIQNPLLNGLGQTDAP